MEDATDPTWLLQLRSMSINNKMRRVCHPDGKVDGVLESNVKK